jgi:hypothetical protein
MGIAGLEAANRVVDFMKSGDPHKIAQAALQIAATSAGPRPATPARNAR